MTKPKKMSFEYPKKNEMVIVEGGVAMWDGEQWYSCTEYSKRRPIEWEVKWWRKLLTLEDHLRLHAVGKKEPADTSSALPWPVLKESSFECDHKFIYPHEMKECLHCGLLEDDYLAGMGHEKIYQITEAQAKELWWAVKEIVGLAEQVETYRISPFEAEAGIVTIADELLKKGIGV